MHTRETRHTTGLAEGDAALEGSTHATGDRPLVDALAMVALLAALLAFILIFVPEHYNESQGGDFPFYVEMAERPLGSAVPAPWRYRPVHPLLASMLADMGLSVNAAFLSLTFVFAVASCLLMPVYLRQLGLSPFGARAGALLFAVTVGGFIPLRRYYGYSDTLTNFCILLVLVATLARRDALTSAALGVGTAVKETLLLFLPFVAWRTWAQSRDAHPLRTRVARVAAIAALPLASFVLLRLVIGPDPAGTSAIALTWDTQVEYWRKAMVHGPARWVLWSFAYSMGPIWLLAAIAAPRHWRWLRASALLILPLIVPLVRTTDTERVLMLTFPVVIPLAAYALDHVRASRLAMATVALAVACAWLAQLTFDWTPVLRLGPVNAKDAVFLALCLLPVLPLALPVGRQRRGYTT